MSPTIVLPAGVALEQLTAAGRRLLAAPRPPAKYRAQPITIGGVRFDSRKEAHRYGTLLLLERAGLVTALERQVAYLLTVDGQDGPTAIGAYVADFVYLEQRAGRPGWDFVVEDVKGYKTPLYRWKKKHFELEYGLAIRET